MNCRFCKSKLSNVFIDLVNSPASNSFLKEEQLNLPELYYPLKVFICDNCFLVQIDEYKEFDSIFNGEYVYFSSFSKSWLEHSRIYTDLMISRFGYNSSSQVIEIASNDGYLLQFFQKRGVPVLGIEPTSNTAQVAIEKGINTIQEFFGEALANNLVEKGIKADLLLGNNVIAHVPDLNDFVKGLAILLNSQGVITIEFPHLLQLILHNQFDTIYHEHFSYLSLFTLQKVFLHHGLVIFDAEELPTHGGSLRIYARHSGDNSKLISSNVDSILSKELAAGINNLDFYKNFRRKAFEVKIQLLSFLLEVKKSGKSVAGYGAAAKGNTLLNYCGIKNDLIDFVVDRNPVKQNKYLPGSHILVTDEEVLKKMKPDYILIFPWNIKDEVMEQLAYAKLWGAKFVLPIPSLTIL